MSGRGRILFSATVVAALLASGWLRSALALDIHPPCYSRILESVLGVNPHTRMIGGLRAYNRMIQRPLSEFSEDQLARAFEEALAHFSPVSSGFPREEFIIWYRKHPLTGEEWEAALRSQKHLGDLLHEQVARFESAHPGLDLAKTAEEFQEKVRALRKGCGSDSGCFDKNIRKISETSWKSTCIGRNPLALQGMAANLAIANAGYLQKYAQNRGKEPFVWDLFATNLIWTPILAEIGCRSQLGESSAAGKPVELEYPTTYRRAFQGFFNGASKDYWQYMRLSPVIDVSYQGVHLLYEKAQGKEVDLDPSKLALQLGSYLVYDAVYAVPRSMLFTDRLMLRAGPVLRQDLMRATGQRTGKVLYLIPDVGSRVYITAKSADLFKWWEKLSEEQIKELDRK